MRAQVLALLTLGGCASTPATVSTPPAQEAPPPAAQKAQEKPAPPQTRRDALVETLHGVEVADPYRWLEDEKAPEVQAWMNAQDARTRAALAEVPARSALVERLRELFYVEAVGTPVVRRTQAGAPLRLFYARRKPGQEKSVLYVRDGEDGADRVLLDPASWSKDGTVSLGRWLPSWDGSKVVFQRKENAADEATLHVIDVASGQWSKVDVIPGGKYASPSWTPDSKAFYYENLPIDPSIPVDQRPGYTEIRLHVLGQDPAKDALVRERTGDPKTFLAQSLSRDGKSLFVYVIRGWNENDVWVKRIGKDKAFRLLAEGKNALYDVHAWKDRYLVVTDEGAPRKRIFWTRTSKPERAAWKELVPEDKDATIVDARVVGGHLAVLYLRNAYSEIRIHSLTDGRMIRDVALPGIGTASVPAGLQDEDSAYFSYSSFQRPPEIYRTRISSGKTELFAGVELPIDPEPYTVEQVWYPSKDGTKVSMFLVHRKGLEKNGQHPVLLYGYGGFDVSLTPSFSSRIYPWLEAGGVYAVANLRGGGEYGKAWHEAGQRGSKQNVFDDFLAAAEYLVNERYTRPERLAIWGGSNGGLLVGAAMTQRPLLFGAVVCVVPLLDMVRYHLFGSGRTWIPEYGTAEDPEQFAWLHGYSPYHRVVPHTRYPALLMLSSDHDDRVDPLHARKFVAAVQQAQAGPAPVYLRVEKNAGHGGADLVRSEIQKYADQFAFLFDRFGMRYPGTSPKQR